MDEENKAVEEAQEEKPVEEIKTEEPQPEKNGSNIGAILTIIAIILFVVLVARLTRKGSSTTTTPTETPTPTEQILIYKIGEPVKMGDATIAVNKVEFSQGTATVKPATGNEFLNLNIELDNGGISAQTITSQGLMFVEDGNGNVYQVVLTDRSTSTTQRLDGTLAANKDKVGWVGFEITKGATGLTFHYDAGQFGGGNMIVDLGR